MVTAFCPASSSAGIARSTGFSLVELTIAVSVTLAVIATSVALIQPSEGAFQAQPEAADVQQRLRAAALPMLEDLTMAGAGANAGSARGSLVHAIAAVFPYRIGVSSPDPAGIFRPDVVSVVYVPETASQTTTRSAVSPSSLAIDINIEPGCPVLDDHCGFEPNALALLYDDTGAWDLVAVGEARAGTVVRRSGTRPLQKTYAAGSRLVEVAVSCYALKRDSAFDFVQLRRYDGDRTDAPVADNIVSFRAEYFGNPRPPMVETRAGSRPQASYGPRPPPPGLQEPDVDYPAGENCVIKVEGGVQVPRLEALGDAGLVSLSAGVLTDGPWCPSAASPNRFDADLLRIRRVRITLRAQAASAAVRGADRRFYTNPGNARAARVLVPDREAQIEVTPRNLEVGR